MTGPLCCWLVAALVWAAVAPPLTSAVENLNPRPRQVVSELGSVPRFQSPSRGQDQFLLLDATPESVLVGARDVLLNLSTSGLEPQNSIQWKAPGQTIEECHMKGKSESECHNFVRVAVRLHNGRVLVCGTHAFSPQCREYEFGQAEDRFVERAQFSGQAISPYDPRQNATFVYSDELNAIFVGAISDFSASDPLIYRRKLDKGDSLRTQKDDRVIDEPQFVGSFVHNDFAYFFYREKAAEVQDNNREAQFYSRVGRVCANDPGGPSPAQDRWSSFLKARLNCSIAGEATPFYFNEIQAISGPVPDGAQDAIVYAVFQTSSALPMSAVCSFRLSQIDAIFDHGRFKTQRSPTSLWTPFQKFYPNPAERPGRCVSDSKRLSDMSLISKNPLMYDSVLSSGNRPLLIEGPNRPEITSIAVSTQVKSVRGQAYNAIFLGRADGTLSKLVEISPNGSAVLVETVRVFAPSANEPSTAATAITGIRVVPGDSSQLVAATLTQLVRLPPQHCAAADSCARCVGLRDPHCAWDIELRRCVQRRDWSTGSYVQNVLLGVSEQCPGSPNLLGPEGGTSYVIDEDPAGERGWTQKGAVRVPLFGANDDPDQQGVAEDSASTAQNALDPGAIYSAGGLSALALVVLVATVFGFLVWALSARDLPFGQIGWRISKWRMLSELARNASAGSSTSSNSSDYADGLGGAGSVRARLARQDSAENKMMVFDAANVYSMGPRSTAGDTVSLVMSQRGAIHHMVPLTSISNGASRAGSGFVTPRHDVRLQTASVGATLPRDYRVKKVYL